MPLFMDMHSIDGGIAVDDVAQAVLRIHERAGHPAHETYELSIEV